MAPAVVSASDAQPFKLTLAPAFALVAPNQHEVSFLLVNSAANPVHIVVSASDLWVTPAEKSFDLGARQRHTVKATIAIPTGADAGDHETDVAFSIPPNGDGTIRVAFAVAARVLINAGGTVIHGLHVFGLTAPLAADSFSSPDINLTLSNRGNVHEIVDIAPFGQVLVLRGQTRTLSLSWTHHPFIGWGTITAGGQSVSTLFLPWRLGLGLVALLAGLLLVRQVRKPS